MTDTAPEFLTVGTGDAARRIAVRVRAGGGPVPGSLAVKRYFAQWVSALILMIGYFMAAIDEQKRALHDRICDTRVVHSR